MAGGYYADAPTDARPVPLRVLRALLWAETALTAVMSVAGLVAAGPSGLVLAHLAAFAWPGAVSCVAALRWARPRAAHFWCLVAATAWQMFVAVSELAGGDPRGLTSLFLPATIAVLLWTPRIRAHYPRGGRGSRDDTGATATEYAALIALAAVILGTFVALGLPSRVGGATRTGVCSILGTCTPRASDRAASGRGRNDAGSRTPLKCHGLLQCTWRAITTDPYDAAQRMPCTGVLSCAGHGALMLFSSQWNVDKAIIGDAAGLAQLAKDPGSLAAAASYIKNHPDEALRQLVWDDESAKLWTHGNYIGAVSRGVWNVGSWLIPGGQLGKGLGEAGKLGKLAEEGGKLGRLARAARNVSKAADRARRLVAKGDYEGARKAAADARRNADDAEKEARKKGCKAVALGVPLVHFGGRSAVPAEGDETCRRAADAEREAERATERIWERTIENPHSLRGMSPEEVEKMIPKSWSSAPARKHGGIRYFNPKKKGDQVVIEGPIPGYTPPNVHAGKYIKVSRKGKTDRIPLEGNPAL